MSINVYVYTEIRRDRQWEAIPEPVSVKKTKTKSELVPVELFESERELFSILSGYNFSRRSPCEDVKPIAEPRGFPTDMNQVYANYFLPRYEYSRGYGYHSWLTVREIVDFDWEPNIIRIRVEFFR